MSGFTARTRKLVDERDRGMCVVCRRKRRDSHHHRRPRQMGGSREQVTSSPANALSVCGSGTTGCHGWIESHRERAYELGLLVRRGHDPRDVPTYWRGEKVYLGDDGTVHPTGERVALL